jgi:hypothetical protein
MERRWALGKRWRSIGDGVFWSVGKYVERDDDCREAE